jgi:hypothetical protein
MYTRIRRAPLSKHGQSPSLSAARGAAALPKELLMKYPSHGGLRGTGEDTRLSIRRLGLLFHRLRIQFLNGFASG